MTHRTDGKIQNCSSCRFWSEMIAQATRGTTEAVCIAPREKSRMSGKYLTGLNSCSAWASGHDGAVDEPGSDPTRYDAKPK